MSKNYFGLLDSRNTKFQGLINNDSFNGLGILIDHLYTFILTNWKFNTLNGPSLLIFPTLQILFGQMQNNKPKGIFCYQLSGNQQLLLKYQNLSSQSSNEQILSVAYIIKNQSIVFLQKDSSSDLYKAKQTVYIKNQQQTLKFLCNVFKSQVKKQHIDILSFLNTNFVQKNNLFELSGQNQIFFGFKNIQSLGLKILNNAPTCFGYFSKFPRNLIFGRKIHYNISLPDKTKIQEGSFQQPFKSFICTKQKEPSIQSQKFCQQYFKKSTTFRNNFIKLDYLKVFHNSLKKIYEQVKLEVSKKFGQSLLQNDYGSTHSENYQIVTKQYTLQQIKEQIYKAAAKKKNFNHVINKSPIKNNLAHNQNQYIHPISPDRKYDLISSKRQFDQIPFKKTYKNYLAQENEVKNRQEKYFKAKYPKKDSLIRKVNQILEIQKQEENQLMKQLITEDIILNEKQKQIQKQLYLNTQTTNRKYKRYEPLTEYSRQQRNPPGSQLTMKTSLRKRYRYSPSQLSKQNRSAIYEVSPNQILRPNKIQRPIQEFRISEFSQNQRSYSNLSKYRERRKQNIDQRQQKINYQNRYTYLKQNEQENDEKTMKQIKLFDNGNKNTSKQLQRLSSYRNIKYNDQNSSQIEKQSYQLKKNSEFQQNRNQKLKELDFNKYNLSQRNIISRKEASYLQKTNNDLTNKKLKKTYHYVD